MTQPRLLNKLYIRDKHKRKVLFIPNKAQLHYLNRRTGRDFVLKARQLGITTLEQARKLEKTLLTRNFVSSTIAHKKDKTEEIFKMAKFMWDSLPEAFRSAYKIKYNNVKELDFSGNGSRYNVTLETRSGTVNDLHISELAFVKNIDELFASSLESVPEDGDITLETTANGLNSAHDLWQETIEGKNEFTAHFYNWTWDDEYRAMPPESSQWKEDYKDLAKKYNLIYDIQNLYQLDDMQFYWYYLKARRLKERTKQEYPTIPEEAFLSSSISVFDLFKVSQMRPRSPLRKFKGANIYFEPIPDHIYTIGVDTAEGTENDGTSIEVYDVTGNINQEVVSFLDDTIRPDQAGDIAMDLGYMYNTAFIIPERNSSGLTTTLRLQEKGYPNLFIDLSLDKMDKDEKQSYGWRTTNANRDVMIDDFVEQYEEGSLDISSPYVISQMKTFIRKKNGRREHDQGKHDDSLFGSFLAIQGKKYARNIKVEVQDAGEVGL